MLFGIDVIIVAPGAVKTPIWGKAEDVDISAYKNSPYLPGAGASPQIHATSERNRTAAGEDRRGDRRGADVGQPKVRYQLTPDPMRHLITGVLPKRTVDKIIAKRLGLVPPA